MEGIKKRREKKIEETKLHKGLGVALAEYQWVLALKCV